MSTELPVPVVVDPETGGWSVDGFPMLLIPRHYWVQIMSEIEAAIGPERAENLYFDGTYKAARVWCEAEAATHGLAGIEVFSHYLKRMTERGWGRFAIEAVDPAAGTAAIRIDHSAVALARGEGAGSNVCHMFNGAFCGGIEYVAAEAARPLKLASREIACRANGADACRFEVGPAGERLGRGGV